MPRSQSANRLSLALEAAFLCGEREMSQKEASERLRVSQPYVSRLLDLAQAHGWLEKRYRFRAEKVPPDRLKEMRGRSDPKVLEGLLAAVASDNGVHVRTVRVVGHASRGNTEKALTRRLSQFGREAAVVVAELIPRSSRLAVTWGRTVSCVVDGMPDGSLLKGGRPDVRFVPVCGEPYEQASNRDTSSHLAERLHLRVGSIAAPPPSLTGIPALIPRRYRGAEARAIWKFVQESASYAEVFGSGSADPLIDGVDSLLTSAGSAGRPMGFVHEELLRAASVGTKKLTRAGLTRLVAGDVGGVLIPRRDGSASEHREVDTLNEMWTGLRRHHLERIATEANAGERPGVIVVSVGGDGRAEIIAEALRCGLVNALIIDPALATDLARVLAA